MTAHNLKHSRIAYFPLRLRCLRLFALCFANNTYSRCLSSPANSGAQITALCLSDGARSPSPPIPPTVVFSFPRHTLKWLCFPTAIQWHPQPGSAKKSASPELEPGPVYTNSSEKYGCIIIEAVSFNVASSLWKPLHAWSATMRVWLMKP